MSTMWSKMAGKLHSVDIGRFRKYGNIQNKPSQYGKRRSWENGYSKTLTRGSAQDFEKSGGGANYKNREFLF